MKQRSLLFLYHYFRRSVVIPFFLSFAVTLSACTSGGAGAQNKGTPSLPGVSVLPATLTPAPTTIALPTATPLPTVVSGPTPVIIDTDMARDDWMAILYLLNRPDVDVKAITVTGTGEAHCGPGVSNALKLVALAKHAPIPVACGREVPLQGNHVYPQSWRNSVDGLSGLTLPDGTNPAPGSTALQLLTRFIQASPEKVQILALGPLTNLAEAFQGTPGLVDNIKMIAIMGGAVNVPGNLRTDVSGNTTAEWNIYIDPHAANIVFASRAPVTMVGLDATNYVQLTTDFYTQLQALHTASSAQFVYDVLSQMQDFIKSGSFYFWDPLAAGILTDETLATFQQDAICVVEEEGPESGRTRISTGCPSVRVAVFADGSRFERMFIDALNSQSVPVSIDFSPLVGTWSGLARSGTFEMQVSITMSASCLQGAVCGNFNIVTLPCSGDFVFVGMSTDNMFQFSATNKQGTCGVAQDFLQPQADGTLVYVSRSTNSETKGILSRVSP